MQSKQLFYSILKKDLSSFVKKCFQSLEGGTEYIHNWHIDLICEYLIDCYNGKITRLNINIPPRFLKSFIISICFPMWVLGKDPSKKFICVSYSASLSNELNDKCRSIANQGWYKECFPSFSLENIQDSNKIKDTQKEFVTTLGGGRYATSTNGTCTGKGADFIIMDDIINPSEANSEVQRINAINWVRSTLFSRFNNKKKGVMVNIQQRVHEKDITGEICKEWVSIVMPIYFNKDCEFKYKNFFQEIKEGDFLNKTLYDKSVMEKDILDMGSLKFNCQYMQNPAPDDGNIFKANYWNFYDRYNFKTEKIYISIDTASKTGEENDPSVIQVWGIISNQYYLIDNCKKKLEYPELKETCKSFFNKYNPDKILIEDKSSGQSLIQDLRKETKFNIIDIKVNRGQDKYFRATTCVDVIEGGRVFLPKLSHFIEDYLYEFKMFPNAEHDDQVDATTQFLNYVKNEIINTPRIRGF